MYKIAITSRKKEDQSSFYINNTYYQFLLPYFQIECVLPRLSHDYQDIVKRNDALLICGGDDIDPYYYHQPLLYSHLEDSLIETMDFALLQQFYQAKKKIFGICRGIQVINVFFHGSLYQDISTQYSPSINHQEPHLINSLPHTFLSSYITDKQVNSYHHQNISKISPLFHINAISEDGLIEGIENHQVLAVQWHPERMNDHQFIHMMIDFINS